MKKLRAGALQLVIFIVIIIALILSSFIILLHTHKQFKLQTNHMIEMVKLTDKGIQYALTQPVDLNKLTDVSLYGEDYKSLKVKKTFWGVFEQVTAKTELKSKTFSKIALVGSQQEEPKISLYLKDNNYPLVVVGDTKIEGLVYLPKRGVKTGHISGHSYYGSTLVNGKILVSQQFPKLKDDLITHIESLIALPPYNQNTTEFLNLESTKKQTNSFNNSMLLAYSDADIILHDIELCGHIVVRSDTKISVHETAKLNDVILIAPIINILNSFEGTLQAFASQSITVSENVILDYPSSLVLFKDFSAEKENEAHVLEMKPTSKVKGSVLCLGKTSNINYDVQLRIDTDAEIEGEVYCEQNMELKGHVFGTVYAKNFIVKNKGTTYQNHLYNAEININKLTKQFVGAPSETSKKKIAKWLY
ncbi:hypothetical protein [uncultured Psychroserpens sp.]|uniref:hypothetical protein n=1 Tax=uncultured Psychroserpens sp. TaxID=255436 RepID=UPI0026316548|nr:hypothetical protein [uncultured Psychroserpens sp.]